MKGRVTHALGIVVCALMFALPTFAQSQARIVRLSYLSGAVQIDRNSGQGFERAIMNMPVIQGTLLQTHDGQAEVEFENGSTVRLTPETRVLLDALSLREDGTKVTSITVEQGVAYFNFDHRDHNAFRLQIAGHDVELKKSARFRVEVSESQVRVAVFKGELNVVGPGEKISVHKNRTFSFDPNNAVQYALAKGVDEYQFDAWDRQREQYQSQYARNAYVGGRNVPYYGFDDLNYYGAFSYFPGYGYMWRPYGVGYGWDPFSVGYWVSYPALGYTWVSPYAWGWTPYRYGGWNFISGSGWYWRPGDWHRGWHRVPPVVNPPSTFVPPRPPMLSRGGVIPVGTPGHMRPWNNGFDNDRDNRGGPRIGVRALPTPNITTGGRDGVRALPPNRAMTPGIAGPGSDSRVSTPHNTARPPQRHAQPPSAPMRSSGAGTDRGSFGGRNMGGGSGSSSGRSMGGGGSVGGGGHSGAGPAGGRSPR